MTQVLYLMRHGETLFNVQKKIQGWSDSPLTELGIAQAKAARCYFEENHITFTHAYSSSLERTCDTLELVSDLPYVRLKGLKEWHFGIYEGAPEYMYPFGEDEMFFANYGGESKQEMRERILQTIQSIMKQEDHTCVLALSHGMVCKQLVELYAQSDDMRNTAITNCMILKFSYENGSFCLEERIDPCEAYLDRFR